VPVVRLTIGHRLCQAARRQARLAGGVVGEFDGLVATLALLPRFDLNLVYVEREPSHPQSAMAEAMNFCADRGADFALDLQSGRHPGVERAAAALGLIPEITRPAMVIGMEGFQSPATPEGVELRTVGTDMDVATLAHVQAEGSTFDRATAEALFPVALLAEPGLRAHLAWLDHEPVAAALVHLDQRAAGVYWVVTLPWARGRGIGAALVGGALADAAPRADYAWLQTSRLGRPVYERLGFVPAGNWVVWRRPSSP
jgi:GNAT superfamily N-acetyltransferase